ncbi:MAG: hypothetical protein JWN70_1465 [Planctomycetaceae bacterium]|nr:hypothetical protein [Planctomycetaceae bacterium]
MNPIVESKLRELGPARALTVLECLENADILNGSVVEIIGVSCAYLCRSYMTEFAQTGPSFFETLRLGKAVLVKHPGLANYLSRTSLGLLGGEVSFCQPARLKGRILREEGCPVQLLRDQVESYILHYDNDSKPLAIDVRAVSRPDPKEITEIENNSWLSPEDKRELIALRWQQSQKW